MTYTDPIHYYATHGTMTDPGRYRHLLDPLPCEPQALCAIVDGLLIHDLWIGLAGLKVPEERRQLEVNLRSMQQKLPRILALDPRPLTEARPFEERFLGNCRDLALLLCAMLRHAGTPARVRAGFGTYFDPQGVKREDHWVVEYWLASEQRWVMVDPQMQQIKLYCERLPQEVRGFAESFPAMDMPPGLFLTGGQAWQLCRQGDDPLRYGIAGDLWGLWFVRGTMLRDLACLNKVEPLPWDCWGIVTNDRNGPAAEEMDWLDHVAEVTIAADAAFSEVCGIYEATPGLHMPAEMAGGHGSESTNQRESHE